MRSFVVFSQQVQAPALDPALYVVATPIGNLNDITLRALQVLAGADLVLCEDTRTSRKLLTHFDIQTPVQAYHDFSDPTQQQRALSALNDKHAVALISDAGTPLISDPGYKLVQHALLLNHKVIPIVGASAVMAALCGAGLATDSFTFLGFLPTKTKQRREKIQEISFNPHTTLLFEAPHRIEETLADLHLLMPERQMVVARELTKHFETFHRGSALDILKNLQDAQAMRGEMVIVIAPHIPSAASADELDASLLQALANSSVSQAARDVADALRLPKKQVYARALALSVERENEPKRD